MISNPKFGWCDFKLESFTGSPSYLTDVPMDLLDALISCLSGNTAAVMFDEESTEFFLVLSLIRSNYIISSRDESKLFEVEMSAQDIAREVLDDIRACPDKWSEEFCLSADDPLELEEHTRLLNEKLDKLEFMIEKQY